MDATSLPPAVILFVVVGVFGLKYGADWLVDGATNLGFRLGISAVMIGLTIVAFGTSAPELVVSAMTAYDHKPEICLGNVIGSNLANTSLILGATALVFPLHISKTSVTKDGPISFFAIFLVCILAIWGLSISRIDGVLLLIAFATWMIWLVRKSLRESKAKRAEAVDGDEEVVFHKRSVSADIGLILVGLLVLVIGAKALVSGAVATATALGVSDIVVGMTVVALGTSLPELAVCMAAAVKHHADITVGNVLGSNVFNALLVLGVAVLIFPINFDLALPADKATLYVEIPICVLLCLLVIPLMRHKYTLGRGKGLFLLLLYVGYVGQLVYRNM